MMTRSPKRGAIT
uniref:Uncharacterized protein n=1 Tax=Arundo donax TaxID=35708 RepID=A0A0A8Y2M8_ARUDO